MKLYVGRNSAKNLKYMCKFWGKYDQDEFGQQPIDQIPSIDAIYANSNQVASTLR